MGYAHVLCPIKLVAYRMEKEDYLNSVKSLKQYIKKFFRDDLGKASAALHELNDYFKTFEGKSREFVCDEYDPDPSAFLAAYGRKMFPSLVIVATRLYRIVPSSAASKRGWNVFSTIHTKKRNRLSAEKTGKLAFVYINAALLDEVDKKDYFLDEDSETDTDDDVSFVQH